MNKRGNQMVSIEDLPHPPEGTPDYVRESISERLDDLKGMSKEAQSLIAGAHTIVDVGPGEGVSSMALAQLAPNAKVTGIEMDQRHLLAAWPECKNFRNLELYWGALPETPSNPQVNEELSTPPSSHLPAECYDILFSWIGISRRDIFLSGNKWCHLVNSACVVVAPRFWREGLGVLSNSEQESISRLCQSLTLPQPCWKLATGIPGFARLEAYPIEKKVKARGWILWLTGIFDSSKVSLWDTLRDQWQPSPKYSRPDLSVGLEVLIGYKK